MEMFANFTPPACYTKHIAYLNFSEFDRVVCDGGKNCTLVENYEKPIYINMVREPVNRIVSWYYYVRAPWYIFTMDKNSQPVGKWKWENLKQLKT